MRRDVRDLPLDCLKLRDGLAKRTSLLRVRDRLVERTLRQPDAHRRHPDSPPFERLHELPEASAAPADEVRFRHSAVLEAERSGVGGAPAHLAVRLADLVAGVPLGTRMLEISRRPLDWSVTAVIVTQPEMSVPALVMNVLDPLMTHSPSLSRRGRPGISGVRASLGLG